MIVTRQRPKRRQLYKILLPLAAVLLLALALLLPASRNVIINGPLAPVWRVVGGGVNTAARPFHFAALNTQISARDRAIAQLQAQINTDKAQISDRDKQITALQSQLAQVMQQNAADRIKGGAKPAPQPSGGSAFGGAQGAAGSDLTASATPDMRRTAAYWASMDAETAAKVIQRLPVPYVARIFALMPADAVGQILNNLPAAYAAQLTQEHPELRR